MLNIFPTYPVPDHGWTGVIRNASQMQSPTNCDGMCTGFGDEPQKYRKAYAALLKQSVEEPLPSTYGVWFYIHSRAVNESNAVVNVGRSFRSPSRCDVSRHFYNTSLSANALCTHNPGDALWCHFARLHGYDSIQVQRGTAYYPHSRRRMHWSELVLCTADAVNTRFSASACVPFARAATTGTPCACHENASWLKC